MRGEATIGVKEIERGCGVDLVGRQFGDKQVFIVGNQQWQLFGGDTAHAMGRNEIAVKNVHDDLLNAPYPWRNTGVDLRVRESGCGGSQCGDARFVGSDGLQNGGVGCVGHSGKV